jgi:hypothetical protein
MAQVAVCLPSKVKALSSNPRPGKKKKERKNLLIYASEIA